MLFIETPVFTAQVLNALAAESYRALQLALAFRPEQGAIIPGSGGIRKVRWAGSGRGKRGGVRVLYFWDRANDTVYFLFLFSKNQRSDLSARQLGALRRLVRELLQ